MTPEGAVANVAKVLIATVNPLAAGLMVLIFTYLLRRRHRLHLQLYRAMEGSSWLRRRRLALHHR
jgi:hypothetical protein